MVFCILSLKKTGKSLDCSKAKITQQTKDPPQRIIGRFISQIP
jgi:hypothetical protein